MLRSLAAVLALAIPLSAHAADQTIRGNQLLVKDPSTADKRKVVTKAKETTSPNTIVGNPATSGATLQIRANGGTPSSQTYSLPTGISGITGKPFWTGDATKGFKYKDPKGENGPVKIAQIKKTGSGTFQIKAVITAKVSPVTVVPPNDGTDGCVLFTITGGDSYSVLFADGVVTNKGPKQFKIVKPTLEGTCVTTTSSSTTTTTSSSTTTTTLNAALQQPDDRRRRAVRSAGLVVRCRRRRLRARLHLPLRLPRSERLPVPLPERLVHRRRRNQGHRPARQLRQPRHAAQRRRTLPIESSDYNRNDGFSPGASILPRVPNVDLAMTGAAPITDVERSLDVGRADRRHQRDHARAAPHLGRARRQRDERAEPRAHHPPRGELRRGHALHRRAPQHEGRRRRDHPAQRRLPRLPRQHADRRSRSRKRGARTWRPSSRPGAAGIARNDLYLAWDFTVASQRNITERLLFMRDDAFAALGSAAPSFVDDDRRERGRQPRLPPRDRHLQVERYVDTPSPPARVRARRQRHADPPGHAAAGGVHLHHPARRAGERGRDRRPGARVDLRPRAARRRTPRSTRGNVRDMANEHNFVFCATKWIGMARRGHPERHQHPPEPLELPEPHRPPAAGHAEPALPGPPDDPSERLHRALPRSRMRSGNPVIDTQRRVLRRQQPGRHLRRHGHGGRAGHHARRARRARHELLAAAHAQHRLRPPTAAILYPAYPNELQRPLLLALIQMLWDRSEPNGYAHHITTDPLPNTPAHKVLLHVAFGDHQVANVATEIEARTIGASIHQPAIAAGPALRRRTRTSASRPSRAIRSTARRSIIWDSGAATPPITNTAPDAGADPHSDPRNSSVGRQQKSDFLKTGGSVTDVCLGIPCVAP